VYGYLNNLVSLEEAVGQIAVRSDSPIDAIAELVKSVAEKIEGRKPSAG
jgi:hypothetical protein